MLSIWTKLKKFSLVTLYHIAMTFNKPLLEALENIVGKVENAGNQHFLLSCNVFYPVKY